MLLDNTGVWLVLVSLQLYLVIEFTDYLNLNWVVCVFVYMCFTDQGTSRCAGAAPVAERTERAARHRQNCQTVLGPKRESRWEHTNTHAQSHGYRWMPGLRLTGNTKPLILNILLWQTPAPERQAQCQHTLTLTLIKVTVHRCQSMQYYVFYEYKYMHTVYQFKPTVLDTHLLTYIHKYSMNCRDTQCCFILIGLWS